MHSLVIHIDFQTFFKLTNHGFYKLSTKIVVPGIQQPNQCRVNSKLFW